MRKFVSSKIKPASSPSELGTFIVRDMWRTTKLVNTKICFINGVKYEHLGANTPKISSRVIILDNCEDNIVNHAIRFTLFPNMKILGLNSNVNDRRMIQHLQWLVLSNKLKVYVSPKYSNTLDYYSYYDGKCNLYRKWFNVLSEVESNQVFPSLFIENKFNVANRN